MLQWQNQGPCDLPHIVNGENAIVNLHGMNLPKAEACDSWSWLDEGLSMVVSINGGNPQVMAVSVTFLGLGYHHGLLISVQPMVLPNHGLLTPTTHSDCLF